MNWRLMGPTLLALGIVVSTVVAKRTADAGFLVLLGPGIMAAVMMVVAVIDHRRFAASSAIVGSALILSAAVMAAGIISALRDSTQVVDNMWLYGAGASAALSLTLGRGTKC